MGAKSDREAYLLDELRNCYETQARTTEMLLITSHERAEWEFLETTLQDELSRLQQHAASLSRELKAMGAAAGEAQPEAVSGKVRSGL